MVDGEAGFSFSIVRPLATASPLILITLVVEAGKMLPTKFVASLLTMRTSVASDGSVLVSIVHIACVAVAWRRIPARKPILIPEPTPQHNLLSNEPRPECPYLNIEQEHDAIPRRARSVSVPSPNLPGSSRFKSALVLTWTRSFYG